MLHLNRLHLASPVKLRRTRSVVKRFDMPLIGYLEDQESRVERDCQALSRATDAMAGMAALIVDCRPGGLFLSLREMLVSSGALAAHPTGSRGFGTGTIAYPSE